MKYYSSNTNFKFIIWAGALVACVCSIQNKPSLRGRDRQDNKEMLLQMDMVHPPNSAQKERHKSINALEFNTLELKAVMEHDEVPLKTEPLLLHHHDQHVDDQQETSPFDTSYWTDDNSDQHDWPSIKEPTYSYKDDSVYNDDMADGNRKLQTRECGIFKGNDSYFYPETGKCYSLGGTSWNDQVTWMRASSATCVQIWEHQDGGRFQEYCGSDWLKLQSLSRLASRVCCVRSSSSGGSGSSGSGSTIGGGSNSGGSVGQTTLAVHNKYRSQVGVSDLQWSSSLAASAQTYANTLASTGRFEHSGQSGVGESLAKGTAGSYNAERLTELWADERQYFRAGRNFPDVSTTGNWGDVGHYTQMVWRDTTTVGCATAEGRGSLVLVCHYSSPGNVHGRRPF